jgi:hypothetical protein
LAGTSTTENTKNAQTTETVDGQKAKRGVLSAFSAKIRETGNGKTGEPIKNIQFGLFLREANFGLLCICVFPNARLGYSIFK